MYHLAFPRKSVQFDQITSLPNADEHPASHRCYVCCHYLRLAYMDKHSWIQPF